MYVYNLVDLEGGNKSLRAIYFFGISSIWEM